MRFEETTGISHLIKAAQLDLRQKIDAALDPLKISAAQYAVLSALEEASVLTNADLARICSVTPQTMIRLMQRLEKDKLVKKQADPHHGLKLEFVLSKKGLDTICAAHISVNQIEQDMLSGLPEKDVEKLMWLLRKCSANLKNNRI